MSCWDMWHGSGIPTSYYGSWDVHQMDWMNFRFRNNNKGVSGIIFYLAIKSDVWECVRRSLMVETAV